MLRIRLRRVGKKGQPSYRVVVVDAKFNRDGRYVEWIGHYNPLTDPPDFSLDADKANEWIKKGAQPSEAVQRILKWQGIRDKELDNEGAD